MLRLVNSETSSGVQVVGLGHSERIGLRAQRSPPFAGLLDGQGRDEARLLLAPAHRDPDDAGEDILRAAALHVRR